MYGSPRSFSDEAGTRWRQHVVNQSRSHEGQTIAVSPADLRRFATKLLVAAGMPDDDAGATARILVEANVRGIDTHGVLLLPLYVRLLRRGSINPTPRRQFIQRRSAIGILDADHGMGHAATTQAMDHAIRMAKQAGVATVLVKNSNHFGAAGCYAMAATRHNCIGMVWSPAEPSVVPFGGRQRFFGTNPIAISAPPGNRYPGFTVDMATSVVAGGKIQAAGKNHRTIPPGWAIDQQGRPVTQPSDDDAVLRSYSCLPMSGAKGYGLAAMIDWTTSLLVGTQWGPTIARWSDDTDERSSIAHYVQALDVEAFVPLPEYRRRVDEFCAALKAVPPAEGFTEVMLPGEPELNTARERERTGCPLSPHAYKVLSELGAAVGVPFPVHLA